MRIGNRDFDFKNECYIMGILNITPDSFSDGGRYTRFDDALFRAEEMVSEGAAIIDVGGESTRPGHVEVSADEEIDRVVPVLEALKKRIDVPVSLDTWKYEVAAAGISAGVDLINDVNGLLYDEGQMARLIAESALPCCLMHNGRLAAMSARADTGSSSVTKSQEELIPFKDDSTITDANTLYLERFQSDANNLYLNCFQSDANNLYLNCFQSDIDKILKAADQAGISKSKIILDPGIGFGKNQKQNLTIMKNLSLMNRWGLPVLLGTSRKTMIGKALDLPVDEREEGTLATTVIGRMAGVSIFRVHNVKSNYRALKMADIILNCDN